jgi:uncharacterized protein (UPF0276 family)
MFILDNTMASSSASLIKNANGGQDLPLPLTTGVGLKPEHYQDILRERPFLGFFEVHAENYMGEGGAPHRYLTAIRENYPVSVHGVGLSIGADTPLSQAHLARLKAVIDRYEPAFFSEHLAWSTHGAGFLNDLLPVPYTQEALRRVIEHIDTTQSYLGRRMLLENPSTYIRFSQSTYSETDFINEVVKRTGCGLLLDINNVHVSAINHGFDPYAYLDQIECSSVGEFHLAGHAREADEDEQPLLIDTHDRQVDDAVWSLYAYAIKHIGPRPTLIERDSNIPEWPALLAEAHQADAIVCDVIGQASHAPFISMVSDEDIAARPITSI